LSFAKTSKVVYVSGEESASQLYSRFNRVSKNSDKKSGKVDDNFIVVSDTSIEKVAEIVKKVKPELVIIDSIQTMVSEDSSGYAGSISMVRVVGYKLTQLSKQLSIPFVIVGQINKEGGIAGPKVLEHMVDCVVYMEGDSEGYYRILKTLKNRFGATSEIGVFEMTGKGLVEVKDPSGIFVEMGDNDVGAAVGAWLNGSRVVFAEVQALVVDHGSSGGPLKRVVNGVSRQRVEMLAAVLSRYSEYKMYDRDIFINVVGGLKVDDPLVDLAIVAAMLSSYRDQPLPSKTVWVGEVGLTGRVRGSFGIESIVKESERLGYKALYSKDGLKVSGSLKYRGLKRLSDLSL
jgi:DNA repair protein RadA/Sms